MGTQNPIVCDNGSGASLASDYKIEIDVTPNATTPKWEELRAGITDFSQNLNEKLDQPQYMDGNGWGSTEVTGGQFVISVSGDRIVGDKAQDFIFSKAFDVGCGRKTNGRITDPSGTSIEGIVTIANIALPSGSSGGKASFSFELHFNGKPDVVTGAVVGP